MKTLLYITNYAGNQNVTYLNRILNEFNQMCFLNVTVIIYTTETLNLNKFENIEVNIKIKPKQFSNSIYATDWQPEPEFIWLHRFDLVNKIDQYDLFLHLEDDILFTEQNIKVFLNYTNDQFDGYIVGEVILEEHGSKNILPQFHMQYRNVDEIITINNEDFFVTKNNHQASWMATKKQLMLLMNNGYMQDLAKTFDPYNIKCSAVTEIYSTNLLKKIIPVDKFEDSLIRHLSKKYITLNDDENSSWYKAFQTKEEIKSQISFKKKLKDIEAHKNNYIKPVNKSETLELTLLESTTLESKCLLKNLYEFSSPFISILIPSYNHAKYIEDSILSALVQDYDNYEIIIVDDGSSDDASNIINDLNNSKVKFILKEHSGSPATRNRCIEEAKGEYLLWLDSDDQLMPNVLTHYVSTLKKHPDIDVLYGDLQIFDQQGDHKIIRYEDHYRENHLLSKLLQGCVIPNGGTLVRKELYNMFGGYDENFRRAHDYEFWSRVVKQASFKHSGMIVCRYRWHDSNLTAGASNLDRSFEAGILKKLTGQYCIQELFPELDWKDTNKSSSIAWTAIGIALHNYLDFDNALIAYEQALKTIGDAPAFADKIADAVIRSDSASAGEYISTLQIVESHSLQFNPLVTVIIVTKNRFEVLKHSLLSLIDQTYENWEAIVVNDTDQDNLDQIISIDPMNRIKCFKPSENENLSSARNTAIRATKGSVICYLDDSMFLPDHITSVVNTLKKNNADFVYSEVIHTEQKNQANKNFNILINSAPSGSTDCPDHLDISNHIPIVSWGHRRDLLEKSGFFDSSLYCLEDWEMLLRFSRITNFIAIQNPTVKMYPSDHSSHDPSQLYQEYRKLYDKYPVDNDEVLEKRRVLLASFWDGKRSINRVLRSIILKNSVKEHKKKLLLTG